jgi:hypothetical protein
MTAAAGTPPGTPDGTAPPPQPRFGLAAQSIAALLAGVVAGLFFGEGIAAEGAERGKILHALGKEGEIFFCERQGGEVLAKCGDEFERMS